MSTGRSKVSIRGSNGKTVDEKKERDFLYAICRPFDSSPKSVVALALRNFSRLPSQMMKFVTSLYTRLSFWRRFREDITGIHDNIIRDSDMDNSW